VSIVRNNRRQVEGEGCVRVLDVGCGNCWLLSLLPPEYARIGIDIFAHPTGVEDPFVDPFGRKSAQFTLGDARELPFRDATFDVVYSNEFVSHVSNIDDAITEQMRVLRRGGVIVIMDANILNPKTFLHCFVVRYLQSVGGRRRVGGMKWLLHRDRPIVEKPSDKRWEGYRDEDIHSHYWWRKRLARYSKYADFKITTFWSYLPTSCFGVIANKVLVTGTRR